MSFNYASPMERRPFSSEPLVPVITPELVRGNRGVSLAQFAEGLTRDFDAQRRVMSTVIDLAVTGEFELDDNDRIIPWGSGSTAFRQPDISSGIETT